MTVSLVINTIKVLQLISLMGKSMQLNAVIASFDLNEIPIYTTAMTRSRAENFDHKEIPAHFSTFLDLSL